MCEVIFYKFYTRTAVPILLYNSEKCGIQAGFLRPAAAEITTVDKRKREVTKNFIYNKW